MSLVTTCFHFLWWHHVSASYYVSQRHKKNNCDPAEDCYQYNHWYCLSYVKYLLFLSGQRSVYLLGGQGRAKFFNWGVLRPYPSGFVAGQKLSWTEISGDLSLPIKIKQQRSIVKTYPRAGRRLASSWPRIGFATPDHPISTRLKY